MAPRDLHPDRDPPAPEDSRASRLRETVEPAAPAADSKFPQLNDPDRVEEDMATVALDPRSASLLPRESERGTPAAGPYRAEGLDDSAIMLQVREGDDAAFNYLVEKYHRAMIHFMFRMVHNQAVAEELAQEVFLRVYRSRQTYRAEARFSTWLYRIATNLGVNHARDTKQERSAHTIYLDEQDAETGTLPDVADARPTAEQDLVREERMHAIRQHVMALPERQRNAVLMHKYQGLDYKQIGAVLKLSESATKSLLFRAYQTLRERLKDFVREN
jgi:RNA polymerase sigma-70 factor, ECF subfamily